MELIERYIYAVTKNLPVKQRADIEKALRSRIAELLQHRTGSQTPQTADIEAVLGELGEPGKLADQYRGHARYLIGPVFYETYWLVLRITLLAAGFGLLIATGVRLATNPPDLTMKILADFFGGLYSALIGAFGLVTLIFALNEHYNPAAQNQFKNKTEPWQPSQLPVCPVHELVIKRSEPIAAIIFMALFLVIINLNLNIISVYIQNQDGYRIVPLFSDYFRQFIPWIDLSLVLAILLEGFKLIAGRWTLPLVGGCLVQKILSLVISLQLLADARLFSSDFFQEIKTLFASANQIWPTDLALRICRILTIIVIVGFVLDVLTIGWKAVRIAIRKPAAAD